MHDRAGAGATGGGTTVVEPRVIFTTRSTTTINRIRMTNTQVTRAMGTGGAAGPPGPRSSVPLTCVVAIVEEPRRCRSSAGARTVARTKEPPAYLGAACGPARRRLGQSARPPLAWEGASDPVSPRTRASGPCRPVTPPPSCWCATPVGRGVPPSRCACCSATSTPTSWGAPTSFPAGRSTTRTGRPAAEEACALRSDAEASAMLGVDVRGPGVLGGGAAGVLRGGGRPARLPR